MRYKKNIKNILKRAKLHFKCFFSNTVDSRCFSSRDMVLQKKCFYKTLKFDLAVPYPYSKSVPVLQIELSLLDSKFMPKTTLETKFNPRPAGGGGGGGV